MNEILENIKSPVNLYIDPLNVILEKIKYKQTKNLNSQISLNKRKEELINEDNNNIQIFTNSVDEIIKPETILRENSEDEGEEIKSVKSAKYHYQNI